MIKSLKFPALIASLLIAIGLLIYGHQELRSLQSDLSQSEALRLEQAEKLQEYAALETADSLVHLGQYDAAIARYVALRPEGSTLDFGGRIGARITFARSAAALRDTLISLKNKRPIPVEAATVLPVPLPEPIVRTVAWREQPSKVDSLTLALRQYQLQLAAMSQPASQKETTQHLTFTSREGNTVHYVGEIADGQANGEGFALLSTGSRYEGTWLNNHKHGEGTFHWSDGAYYVGQYAFGQRSGYGTYHFPDGGKFVGQWSGDLRNGQGVFYNKKGKVVAKGVWQDDQLAEQL